MQTTQDLQSQYFLDNIKALKTYNPLLASSLEACTPTKFQAFQSGEDALDIDIVDIKGSKTIYIDPGKETEQTLTQVEHHKALYPIMYFFGIGNGILMKALLGNEHHQRIVVFEPELEILKIALSLMDFSQDLEALRLVIFDASQFSYGQAFDLVMANNFKVYARLYALDTIGEFYLNHYGELAQQVNLTMTKAIKQMVYSHGNDANDSLVGIRHHLANIPEMVQSYKYLELVHKKNTDVAVVVSLGPSLDKQLPLLKKIKNHVTILCPDASLKTLEQHNIKPDIVVSLERTEIVSTLIDKVSEKFQKNLVFLLASVLHRKSIDAVKGQKVICMRPFGYTFYFEELKEWGYHGVGMSVSNMAHELAYIMKYSKVVLIGQDLAYGPDGESHSGGNVYGKNQREQDDADTYIEAYGGQGEVRTMNGWVLFRNYFESAIEETKATMTTYNCTEGGARIRGALEMPFGDFVDRFVDLKSTKAPIKLTGIPKKESQQKMQAALNYVNSWMGFGTEQKQKIDDIFLKTAQMCEVIESATKEDKTQALDFSAMADLADEISACKVIFQDQTFAQLFFDVVQSYILHQEFELASVVVRHPKDEQERRDKLIQWILGHKFWLFSLSGGMQRVLDEVQVSQKQLQELLDMGEKTTSKKSKKQSRSSHVQL